MSDLSAEAKTLLIEAAKEQSRGMITSVTHTGGYQIQIGGRNDFVAGDRSRAKYKDALQELLGEGLTRGEPTRRGVTIFNLTRKGYEQADLIDYCGGSEDVKSAGEADAE